MTNNGNGSTPQFGDLSSRALFTDLDFHLWRPEIGDKKVADEVADRYQVTRKAGRYTKNLFPFPASDRAEYDELASSLFSVYQYWQKRTVPWQFGVRLLKATSFGEFNQFMKLKAEEVALRKRKFKKVYPEYIERAERFLTNEAARTKALKGGIFNRADYKPWSELDAKFGFDVYYDPVVAPGDFRLELDAELMEELKKNHVGKFAKSQADMTKKLWDGFHQIVLRAVKLGSPGSKVYDTIFTDLTDLADSLPSLNLFDNPEMNVIATEIKNNLYQLDPHIVRTDGGEREDVARKAQRIADRMKKFMS